MKKRVLIDLTRIKNIYTGFGQLSLNIGQYFKMNYSVENAEYELTLLVPKEMVGCFGNEVKYITPTDFFRRHFSFLYPPFDVWHSTDQLSHYIPPVSRRTKYVITIHDLNYLYERKGFSKKRKQRQLQKKINRANEIICISKFTKSEVEKNLNLKGKTCQVIYNGVERLNKTLAQKPLLEMNKPFFFTIGVIKRKKNFHVLLDLMKQNPDKMLYIAGMEDENEKNSYSQFIRNRIKEESIQNVTLLGTVSQEEKIWLYSNCDAFLFPSLFEGFGLPVIEAMQFGKPVFSSKETSLKEIGGEYAFFWDNFDPNEMKKVLDDGLNKTKTDKQFVSKEIEYANSFSFEKYFEKYEELYATL